MSIYKSAINRPVTTLLVFVAVIVIGVFSFLRLPIDQFPEMDPPYISVLTVYPGASASEIETNVTKIIENNLNSVDYLKEITSTTKDNISVVLLELEWGTDLDEIINDVRSYIDMVKDELPDGCTNPFKSLHLQVQHQLHAYPPVFDYCGRELSRSGQAAQR